MDQSTTGRRQHARRDPGFVLTWLDVPNDGSDPTTPLGTCLVLRSTGRRTPRSITVDLPGGRRHVVDRPLRHAAVGVATPVELGPLVAVGTVFVDWESRDGAQHTAWLRLPPVPSRFRHGSARDALRARRGATAAAAGATGTTAGGAATGTTAAGATAATAATGAETTEERTTAERTTDPEPRSRHESY